MMSNDTIIPRTVRNNKRNGTQSVYLESTQPKNQNNATVEDETEEEEKEDIEIVSQDEQDTTSGEDQPKKKTSLSIEGFFKYIKKEDHVYIYECNTIECKQVYNFILLCIHTFLFYCLI